LRKTGNMGGFSLQLYSQLLKLGGSVLDSADGQSVC